MSLVVLAPRRCDDGRDAWALLPVERRPRYVPIPRPSPGPQPKLTTRKPPHPAHLFLSLSTASAKEMARAPETQNQVYRDQYPHEEDLVYIGILPPARAREARLFEILTTVHNKLTAIARSHTKVSPPLSPLSRSRARDAAAAMVLPDCGSDAAPLAPITRRPQKKNGDEDEQDASKEKAEKGRRRTQQEEEEEEEVARKLEEEEGAPGFDG